MKNLKNKRGITLVRLIIIVVLIIVAINLLMHNKGDNDKVYSGEEIVDELSKKKPSPEQLATATTIDYVSLYKGANTLNGNFYKITGEIVQDAGNYIYHINMTKNGTYSTYYTDRIQIILIGEPSEILMEGDIVSFTGQSLGNYTYTTVLGSDSTIPELLVYAENLSVIGHTD